MSELSIKTVYIMDWITDSIHSNISIWWI